MKEMIEQALHNVLGVLLHLITAGSWREDTIQWMWSSVRVGAELKDIGGQLTGTVAQDMTDEDLATLWLVDGVFMLYLFTKTFEPETEALRFSQLVARCPDRRSADPSVLDAQLRVVIQVCLALARERLPMIETVEAPNPVGEGWSLSQALVAIEAEDTLGSARGPSDRLEVLMYASNRLSSAYGFLVRPLPENSVSAAYQEVFARTRETASGLSLQEAAALLVERYEEILRRTAGD